MEQVVEEQEDQVDQDHLEHQEQLIQVEVEVEVNLKDLYNLQVLAVQE